MRRYEIFILISCRGEFLKSQVMRIGDALALGMEATTFMSPGEVRSRLELRIWFCRVELWRVPCWNIWDTCSFDGIVSEANCVFGRLYTFAGKHAKNSASLREDSAVKDYNKDDNYLFVHLCPFDSSQLGVSSTFLSEFSC